MCFTKDLHIFLNISRLWIRIGAGVSIVDYLNHSEKLGIDRPHAMSFLNRLENNGIVKTLRPGVVRLEEDVQGKSH